MILLAAVFALGSFADSVQAFYGQKDVDALATICAADRGREEGLLCRYRLYPLTHDEAYVQHLPADLPNAEPRELALLAGLWGYHAAETSVINAARSGMRSDALLKRAVQLAPDDPVVLLIEAQSYLFRPAIFGGSAGKAMNRFDALQNMLNSGCDCGISAMEVDSWRWYTMRKLGLGGAATLRKRLLAANPPLLYREFLNMEA